MAELKVCPFCGSEPTIRVFRGKDGWRDRYAVICRYDEGGCGAESGLYHYEQEAIEAWNRRNNTIDLNIDGKDRIHVEVKRGITIDGIVTVAQKFGNKFRIDGYLTEEEE